LLLEFRLTDALGRRNKGHAVPDEKVELTVAVDVIDPDASGVRGAGQVLFAEDLPVAGSGPWPDQWPGRRQVRPLPLAGTVLRAVDTAVGAAAQQVQSPVAIPVHDKRVAVSARQLQRLAVRHQQFRRRRELALALSLEPVEGAGEISHDQVQLA